jgi:DNA-binding HxlR family transcriptional regulator
MTLGALASGPKRLADLRRECGSPAQSTLRAYLRQMEGIDVLQKRRRNAFPGILEFELTAAGRELLFVAAVLERWLQDAPNGPLPSGSGEAKAAITALLEGWSSTMLRALATQPLSLTELDRAIGTLSYPSLERRLAAMRLAGQVEACPAQGQGTPYAVTDWLRRGIAPLAVAVRWERRHVPSQSTPITRVDTETAFLLVLPLLRLPPALSGSCRLGVEIKNERKRRLAGAMAHVEGGRVASSTSRLDPVADAWANGSATAWLQAVIASDLDRLELGGDQRLARALVDALGGVLSEAPRTPGLKERT